MSAKKKKPKQDDSLLSPLKIPKGKIGDWSVVRETVSANTPFQVANSRCQIFAGQKGKTVVWPFPTTWTYLKENNGTWMSDIPCEHQQMKDSLKGMRGTVLVGGLGLGLAATILAAKKTVKSVFVVEKAQPVIDLVKPYLKSDKITVLRDDLFNFLKTHKDLEKIHKKNQPLWDYAFYDIWQSDGEGTFFQTVCPLLELSKGVVKHEPSCWNIEVMRGQLLWSLNSRLLFLHPEASKLSGMQRLRPPWEEDGTTEPWHNWSVPFWKWYKETNPPEDKVRSAMWYYAHIYGIWNWEGLWRIYCLASDTRQHI